MTHEAGHATDDEMTAEEMLEVEMTAELLEFFSGLRTNKGGDHAAMMARAMLAASCGALMVAYGREKLGAILGNIADEYERTQ